MSAVNNITKFVWSLLILFLIFYFIVMLVNPYGLLNSWGLDYLFPIKIEYCARYPVLRKLDAVGDIEVAVIGSSSIAYWDSNRLKELEGTNKVFFLGIESSNLEEQLNNAIYLLNNNGRLLRKIYLVQNFHSYNPERRPYSSFPSSMLPYDRFHLSLYKAFLYHFHVNAIKDTLAVIRYNFMPSSNTDFPMTTGWHADGTRVNLPEYFQKVKILEDSIPYNTYRYIVDMRESVEYYGSEEFKKKTSVDKGLQRLDAFLETCKDKGIEVQIVIAPALRDSFISVYAQGLGPTLEHWKSALANKYDVIDLELDDELTKQPRYWWDTHHLRYGTERPIDMLFFGTKLILNRENNVALIVANRPCQQEMQRHVARFITEDKSGLFD